VEVVVEVGADVGLEVEVEVFFAEYSVGYHGWLLRIDMAWRLQHEGALIEVLGFSPLVYRFLKLRH
jgi:hypothetical protein